MRKTTIFKFIALVAVIGVTSWGVFSWLQQRSDDNSPTSRNLSADVALMWETHPLRGTHDPTHGPNPSASTNRAIKAASRVFNTVNLVGKTRDEVISLLGDPKKSNDSTYNFPFHDAAPEALVFRFDNGAYGCQYNVMMDINSRVTKVEEKWIE